MKLKTRLFMAFFIVILVPVVLSIIFVVGFSLFQADHFRVKYGIDIFAINSTVLTNSEKGYFASPVGTVGDTFFSAMVEYNGNYPGFPGYYVVEGNVLFGAEVVRPEAIIKLVAGASV